MYKMYKMYRVVTLLLSLFRCESGVCTWSVLLQYIYTCCLCSGVSLVCAATSFITLIINISRVLNAKLLKRII